VRYTRSQGAWPQSLPLVLSWASQYDSSLWCAVTTRRAAVELNAYLLQGYGQLLLPSM
jgi:hypothetical protein